jgi:hypothetical protein
MRLMIRSNSFPSSAWERTLAKLRFVIAVQEAELPIVSSPAELGTKHLLVLALGFVALTGCSQGEKLYRVSGTVTHSGKPIPKGVIHFVPQADGPAGFANIVDGKYDTAQGQGVRGGSYDIRVNGFDGKEANEAPFGQALFPEYTTTKDLPAADSTYDLDVPKGR